MKRRFWILAALLLVLIGIDQGSKRLMQQTHSRPVQRLVMWSDGSALQPKQVTRREASKSSVLIPGILELRYEENHRVSTRLTESFPAAWRTPVFILLSALILMGILLWFRRLEDGLMVLAVAMVIAGGLANVIDRVGFQYLIDFIELSFTPLTQLFGWGAITLPTFNLGNLWLFIGTVLFVYRSFRPLDEGDVEPEARGSSTTAPKEEVS